jgi:hypothetical protein
VRRARASRETADTRRASSSFARRHPRACLCKEFGGKQELDKKLELFLTPQLLQEKDAIAVIVDADENPAGTVSRFEQLLARVTGQAVSHGAWTQGVPRLGLFVVPAGTATKGEIETLVWDAWSTAPANARAGDAVVSFESEMKAAGIEAHSPAKGRLGALLAPAYDDDPRLGPAARTRKIFDLDAAPFAELHAFLRQF